MKYDKVYPSYSALTLLFAGLFFVLLLGCQAMPAIDTPGKRLATFEIAYSEIQKTATLYLNEGRLTMDQARSLDKLFKLTDMTRLSVYEAWNAGNDEEMDSGLRLLNVSLQSIRIILTEVEQNERIQ